MTMGLTKGDNKPNDCQDVANLPDEDPDFLTGEVAEEFSLVCSPVKRPYQQTVGWNCKLLFKMLTDLVLTCNVETTYRDHQIEIRPVETSAGEAGQPQQERQQEGDIDCRGKGTAAARLLCEDLEHVGVGWSTGVITLWHC